LKRLNLYHERKGNNFTQSDVARFLNVSDSYYSMIENGKRNPSLLVVRKLEELFEHSHDFLLKAKEVEE